MIKIFMKFSKKSQEYSRILSIDSLKKINLKIFKNFFNIEILELKKSDLESVIPTHKFRH